MNRARSTLGWFLLFGILFGSIHALAQRDGMPEGYPQSLEPALQSLLDQLRGGDRSPALLVQVSSTYFDIADDLLTEVPKRQAAYQAGAQAAKEAFTLDEFNADAHFFYAANLGSSERLKGLTNAALVVEEIELNPKHAQALQMMGGLLMELPWFLGGDETKAQEYLERAIVADGNFTHARVLVSKRNRVGPTMRSVS